jgi:alkanesulfonate monooxygenase SsuD/methylene tetrahydromethanopterin reductase-like flavin-dependent oxidoreductase (luciferase family)
MSRLTGWSARSRSTTLLRFLLTNHELAETLNSPQPLRRPPIMIGGGGEKKTLRLVAQYGDACNLFAGRPGAGPDEIKAKREVLREHCSRLGTDFSAIRTSILWTGPLEVTADGGRAFTDEMRRYADIGVDEVHVMPFTRDPVAFVNGLGDHVVGWLENL